MCHLNVKKYNHHCDVIHYFFLLNTGHTKLKGLPDAISNEHSVQGRLQQLLASSQDNKAALSKQLHRLKEIPKLRPTL